MGNVNISFAEAQGRIKDMNSVNNGPDGEFDYGSYDAYAAALREQATALFEQYFGGLF